MSKNELIYRKFYQRTGWVLLVVLLLAIFQWLVKPWLTKINQEKQQQQSQSYVAPKITIASVKPPIVQFTEESIQRGVDFSHFNGAGGEKLLPETMGSGIAVIDFDQDGDLDLFFGNGNSLDGDIIETITPRLYMNDGSGQFTDVTSAAGLAVNMYATGVAVGDVNQDGWEDLLVTALGDNWLFINQQDGSFVVHEKPLNCAEDEWSTSAGFFDYDKDGDEDVFIVNYVEWNKSLDYQVNYQMDGIGKAFGPPSNFSSTHPCLLNNEGGVFTNQSEAAGLLDSDQPALSKGLALLLIDLNKDDWLDVMIANDTTGNQVYINQQNGGFIESGASYGLAYDLAGKATGAMGMDALYFDNAQKMAVAIGNFANESSSFYVNRGHGLFTDESMLSGVGAASRLRLTFGVFFFDYDSDGRLDFFQTNGHVENLINEVQNSQTYQQRNQLFWNCGDSCSQQFIPVTNAGDLLEDPVVGRAAVYADIELDGDLDVIVAQVGQPVRIYVNQYNLSNNWLTLKLTDKNHRSLIGSQITVTSAGHKQVLLYGRTKSYQSQTQLWQHIGLGAAQQATINIKTIYGDRKTVDISANQINQLIAVEI